MPGRKSLSVFFIGIAVTIAMLALGQAVQAGSAGECERMTSHILEAERLEHTDIDFAVEDGVVDICGKAVQQAPDDPHLLLLYGLALIANEEPQKGQAQIERAANAGSLSAEFFMGLTTGMDGVPSGTPEQARLWFQKAAHNGHMGAQLMLATMFAKGIGGERNSEQAVMWMSKAADQGNAGAKFLLGVMYFEGQGVERDLDMAIQLTKESAELGFPKA